MSELEVNERDRFRWHALIRSLEISSTTPEERYEKFLDLQNAVASLYWEGLRKRYPQMDESQLRKMAKKENMKDGV